MNTRIQCRLWAGHVAYTRSGREPWRASVMLVKKSYTTRYDGMPHHQSQRMHERIAVRLIRSWRVTTSPRNFPSAQRSRHKPLVCHPFHRSHSRLNSMSSTATKQQRLRDRRLSSIINVCIDELTQTDYTCCYEPMLCFVYVIGVTRPSRSLRELRVVIFNGLCLQALEWHFCTVTNDFFLELWTAKTSPKVHLEKT